MLYAVISDIHSNLEALQAVLRYLKRKPIRRWFVLGDLVGYGANPNEVIELVQRLRPRTVIRGNHDRVAASMDPAEDFNEMARFAAAWTRQKLTPRNQGFLRHLPVGPVVFQETINLSHGSPLDEDAYVISDYDAYVSFREVEEPLLLFGHTHFPVIYRDRGDHVDTFRLPPVRVLRVRLRPGERYMINPGSIGQPRDRIPLASCCVLDPERWRVTFYRIPYPIVRSQKRILTAGLPEFLAYRLAQGI